MDIYIFDKNLNFKGIIETFTSLRWIRKYNKCGEFELHCGITKENLDLLQRDNIVWKRDDVEAGCINYRGLKLNSDGQEVLVIRGKFITNYADRRIIWGSQTLQCSSEIAMRTLVDKNCITTTSDRIIPNLGLSSIKGLGQQISYQTSYKNLLDELGILSVLDDLGFRINFTPQDKTLTFDVYNGRNLTVNQNENSPVIFSKEFDNVMEQEYTESFDNYKNVGFVLGMEESDEMIPRKTATVGVASGIDRYELFVDASDTTNIATDDDGIETLLTDDEYIALLNNKGAVKLSDCKDITTFESKINVISNLKYKVDYDLGDVVTCMSRSWGVTVDTRITEIEESYEGNSPKISVVFGNNLPTLLDKIKQKMR